MVVVDKESGASAPHLNVWISGAVVPTWLVALGVAGLFLGALGMFAVAIAYDHHDDTVRELVEAVQRQADEANNAAKEIRILQLHVQDAESAMVRAGVATRMDFAPWGDKGNE